MIRLIFLMSLLMVLVMPKAWAGYPNPYRQTLWNDLTDSIHTLGQSPQKARTTKIKLHYLRTQARTTSIMLAQQHAKR